MRVGRRLAVGHRFRSSLRYLGFPVFIYHNHLPPTPSYVIRSSLALDFRPFPIGRHVTIDNYFLVWYSSYISDITYILFSF